MDTICIMIIFIHFLNFVKICRKMVIFWQKNRHFLDFTSRFPLFNFRRKTYQVLGKWSNWANFWYKCSLGYLLQKWDVTFGYVVFLTFYRARYVQRELFFANFGKFWPKKALFFFANHPAGPQLLKTRVYMCFTRTVCGSETEENFSLEGEDTDSNWIISGI